jgi:phage FluMu protein gp41
MFEIDQGVVLMMELTTKFSFRANRKTEKLCKSRNQKHVSLSERN